MLLQSEYPQVLLHGLPTSDAPEVKIELHVYHQYILSEKFCLFLGHVTVFLTSPKAPLPIIRTVSKSSRVSRNWRILLTTGLTEMREKEKMFLKENKGFLRNKCNGAPSRGKPTMCFRTGFTQTELYKHRCWKF